MYNQVISKLYLFFVRGKILMDKLETIIQKVKKIDHGFLDIQNLAIDFQDNHSTQICLSTAKNFFHQSIIK